MIKSEQFPLPHGTVLKSEDLLIWIIKFDVRSQLYRYTTHRVPKGTEFAQSRKPFETRIRRDYEIGTVQDWTDAVEKVS